MGMDVGSTKGGVKSEINVTPLVDVMLVLLIIMMLVAPLLQKGVALTLPETVHNLPKPDTQEQTVVAVDAANGFWVNGIKVDKRDLGGRVQSVLETKKEKIVLIRGDQDAKYSAIMEVMDTLRKVQVEDIALITEKKKGAADAPAGGK